MDVRQVVNAIKRKFGESGRSAHIPLVKGEGTFRATLTAGGVEVDDLGTESFLPWVVFQEAICVLIRHGGRAKRGDAMKFKLGQRGLPLDSVEGHIAHVVYGKRPGDIVFRRITPVACILIWAGVCEHAPGELKLLESD